MAEEPRRIVRQHLERCPQCDFRFRGRPDDHFKPSPTARRLQTAAFIAPMPMLAAVALVLALTQQADGKPLQIAGGANLAMLLIFSPSVLLYALSFVVPKRVEYLCPQCGWRHEGRREPKTTIGDDDQAPPSPT
jgi:hypothetical protein